MIQLQSRIVPYIGQTLERRHQWTVDDEATILTKSMKQALRESQSIAGEREYRIVNTHRAENRA